LIFAVPNGARVSIGMAVKLKKEGLTKGIPDVFVDEPRNGYHGLRIEMKKKGGQVSVEQFNTIGKYKKKGYSTAVCYSAEEAWSVLMDYLGESDD